MIFTVVYTKILESYIDIEAESYDVLADIMEDGDFDLDYEVVSETSGIVNIQGES